MSGRSILADRARAVQEGFEDRQTSTADALAKLIEVVQKDEARKKDQAARGLDSLTYFVEHQLAESGIPNAAAASVKIGEAFQAFPSWRRSEKELRELRKKVTFAIFAEEEDLAKVTAAVEGLFTLLQRSAR